MYLPVFIVMIVLFIVAVLFSVYLFKKHKVHYVPSSAMLAISFLLLAYTQISTDNSWNDLGYVILAFMIIFLSIIVTLIIFFVRYFKYRKNNSKDS